LVDSVAFSPDGTKLLSGESGGEVALWDLEGNRLLFRAKVHHGPVSDVKFSPDGNMVASAGGDLIHLQRVAKPAEVVKSLSTRSDFAPDSPDAAHAAVREHGPCEGIACLAFTPDRMRLVAGNYRDAALFVWDLKDGRLVRKIENEHGARGTLNWVGNPSLENVAVTPDGRRIMSVGQTTIPFKTDLVYARDVPMSEVRFWDIETGQRIADYHGEDDVGTGCGALSRDGLRVAVADFGKLRFLDAATGRTERTIDLPGSWGKTPEFSPDGTLVAMPIHNAIALFEVSTGRRLHHDERSPAGYVESAAWSPPGDRIVTGHSDGGVRVWDVGSGELVWHKPLAPVISRLGWFPRPVFVSFSQDGKVVIAAGRRDDPLKHANGVIAVYDAVSGRAVREVFQQEIRWGALAPEGRMLVVATSSGGGRDTHLIGLEFGSGETRWANPPVEQKLGFPKVVTMQFEANSPWLNVAFRDGNIIRLNALTGHEQRNFVADWRTPEHQKAGRIHEPAVADAAFSGDGRTLVSSYFARIYVWDTESGTIRRTIEYRQLCACELTLSADGHTLATRDLNVINVNGGEPDDLIRLYDVESGEQILTLEPGGDRGKVLAFSADGTKLFSGFFRGTAMVWDVRSERGHSLTLPADESVRRSAVRPQ
jgi:WD40 repeat protein